VKTAQFVRKNADKFRKVGGKKIQAGEGHTNEQGYY